MASTRRRAVAVLIALGVLLTVESAPVDALTLQRTWSARIGSSASNGSITMRAYTNHTGSIHYSLKGLRAKATYTVSIRYGTCSHLGLVANRLTPVVMSSTGSAVLTRSLSSGTMYGIWSAARSPSFVVRLISGNSIRCAGFTFRHATRVAVTALGIDLPIVRGPSGYPYCRVAMYYAAVAQPREPGVAFIFAHARRGMFLPLLTRWKVDHGASLIGRTVKVWTSDRSVSYYRITRVRVTSNAMTGVTSLTRERLWLQTSTGPNTSYPKLIVEAARYSTVRTTFAASHPKAYPVRC